MIHRWCSCIESRASGSYQVRRESAMCPPRTWGLFRKSKTEKAAPLGHSPRNLLGEQGKAEKYWIIDHLEIYHADWSVRADISVRKAPQIWSGNGGEHETSPSQRMSAMGIVRSRCNSLAHLACPDRPHVAFLSYSSSVFAEHRIPWIISRPQSSAQSWSRLRCSAVRWMFKDPGGQDSSMLLVTSSAMIVTSQKYWSRLTNFVGHDGP